MRSRNTFFKIVPWRLILFLTTISFIVQTINVTLSWYIQKKDKSSFINKEYRNDSTFQVLNNIHLLLNKVNQQKVLDSSGEFQVVKGFFTGSNSHYSDAKSREVVPDLKDAGVTIVTQCSLYHLQLLPELAKRWLGSVSVAVFLLGEEIQAGLEALIRLRSCSPEIKANVTFSIVFPLNSTLLDQQFRYSKTLTCGTIRDSTFHFNRKNYELANIPYPSNLLRNIARELAPSPFITVLDIDLMPSAGLHASFLDYVVKNNLMLSNPDRSTTGHKTVWVLPAYEVDTRAQIPDDKVELLYLKQKGLARPFYQELCWKCQKYTDYEAWERDILFKKTPSSANELSTLYGVLWKDPWEPFYIARNNVPFYDERFRQYGFNRISQACELHVSGYEFLVLDSAFVVHRGFKRKGSFHSSKDKEQKENRMKFREFKEDLKKKYLESSRRCY